MIVKILLFSLLLVFSLEFAQCSSGFIFSGYVKDKATGELLIGASVFTPNQTYGTATNTFGFFSLTLPNDELKIIVSYIGYQPDTININKPNDTLLNITLDAIIELQSVEITSLLGINNDNISTLTLQAQQLKNIVTLGSEVDIIKAIQLLPGIKFGNEGTTGLYVRGGGPDQNLVLLDGIPIYNPSHLFGFVSTFNADAIQHISLIKGGFPARYGGRLSSVLDVRMKDGNQQSFHGQGTIGIIASKLMLEGPIKKNKGSFLVSARRSLYELFLYPLNKWISLGQPRNYFNFYDTNIKLNYQLSKKDKLHIGWYDGRDNLSLEQDEPNINGLGKETISDVVRWGNRIAYVRWNRQLGQNMFSNITLFTNKYFFNTSSIQERLFSNSEGIIENRDDIFEYISDIQDVGIKMDALYIPNVRHNIKAGTELVKHNFKPGIINNINQTDTLLSTTSDINAQEVRFYIEDNILLTSNWLLNVGLHISLFDVQSKTYSSIEPRINTRYTLGNRLSIEASYVQMKQYLHLLTNSSLGLPTDLWVPPTANIAPQQSSQFSLGLSYPILSNINLTLESYYKEMQGLINYRSGASFLIEGKDWEQEIVDNGKGVAYGLELLLQKTVGKTTGWIGYTLSYTDRQFDELNQGKAFPYKYDRRHDIAIVCMHQLNKKVRLSLNWVFATGNAITLPQTIYPDLNYPPPVNQFGGGVGRQPLIDITEGVPDVDRQREMREIIDYGGVNASRMPIYQRLDVGVSFFKITKWGERTLDIGVYNVYAYPNPYYVRYATKGGSLLDPFSIKGSFESITLIPILPSISYNFKF